MMIKVKALQDFPAFYWIDMKEYKGLKKGQTGTYPKRAVEILVANKLARTI